MIFNLETSTNNSTCLVENMVNALTTLHNDVKMILTKQVASAPEARAHT